MVNKEALDTLQNYGIHPSVQRIAIMDYLLKNHTHPTVDEVYVALCKVIPTLSKTTVYNTLRLFSEHGAALMLTGWSFPMHILCVNDAENYSMWLFRKV